MQEPEQPEPDDKDWTWVLERPCPDCGFIADDLAPGEIPALIDDARHRFLVALARPDARERPAPTTWSVLEYACHVRDVNRIFAARVESMLTHESPTFPNWDQDETARGEKYHEQIPTQVAAELQVQFADAAGVFSRVNGAQWARPGLRSNGSRFTVESLGRYFAHDLVHHLHDIAA